MNFIPAIAFSIGLVIGCFIGFGISLYQTETIIRSYRKMEAEAQDGFPFQ